MTNAVNICVLSAAEMLPVLLNCYKYGDCKGTRNGHILSPAYFLPSSYFFECLDHIWNTWINQSFQAHSVPLHLSGIGSDEQFILLLRLSSHGLEVVCVSPSASAVGMVIRYPDHGRKCHWVWRQLHIRRGRSFPSSSLLVSWYKISCMFRVKICCWSFNK